MKFSLRVVIHLILFGALSISCTQEKGEVFRKEYIDFYSLPSDELPSTLISVSVMGGTTVFTVRSNVEFKALWQDNLDIPWAKVESLEKKEGDEYALTLSYLPRAESNYYTRRNGTLLLVAPELQLGTYITVNQGLTPLVASDFSWSKYGSSDPRKMDGTPYSKWISTDKNRSWVLDEDAPVFGKNGFLVLGDKEGRGASIYSPYYEGIRTDSLAVVSFLAAAYIDPEGVRDSNKFTVEILGGGVFRDNGSTKMEFEAPYADPESERYLADYWKNKGFLLGLLSVPENPFTGNTRIRISSAEADPSAGGPNRILIDNFYIRRIVLKDGDEDLWTENGGSGKDNLLGALKDESN